MLSYIQLTVNYHLHVDRNLKLDYSSTLEGSLLTLTCENEISLNSTTEMTLNVTCHSNGSWIPNPADFIHIKLAEVYYSIMYVVLLIM